MQKHAGEERFVLVENFWLRVFIGILAKGFRMVVMQLLECVDQSKMVLLEISVYCYINDRFANLLAPIVHHVVENLVLIGDFE